VSRTALFALAGLCAIGLALAVILLSEPDDVGGGRPVQAGSASAPASSDALPPPLLGRELTDELAEPRPDRGQPLRSGGQAPAVIEGRVVDRAGTPRAGATISLLVADASGFAAQFKPTGSSIEADSEGRFRLIHPPLGRALAVEASHAASAPTRVPVRPLDPGETRLLGDLMLSAGTTLTGQVSDELGAPLPGARVELREGVGAGPLLGAAIADESGHYELPHLAPRQYALRASAEGHATMESVQAFVLGAAGPIWTVDFELPRAQSELRGLSTDAMGTPVPGVRLRFLLRRAGSSAHFSTSCTSDEQGRFALRDLPEGRYDVGVESSEWYLALSLGLHTGPEEQAVRVHAALAIRGLLLAHGAEVPEFHVTVKPDGRSGARLLGGLPARRRFGSDGPEPRFELLGLRPGAYSLVVEAPGYSATRSQGVFLQQGSDGTDVTITLLMGATLSGRVSPARPGVSIELREGDWDPASPLEDAFPTAPLSGLRTRTDADGRYRIEHVPAGRVVVSARSVGLPPAHLRDVRIEEGGVYELPTLELSPGGMVRGRLTGPDGQPRAGAKLRLMGEGVYLATQTDGDGSYRFEVVPAGEYELSASPASLAEALTLEARAPLSLRSESEVVLDLRLSARPRKNR